VWAVIAWERIVLARSMDAQGNNKGDDKGDKARLDSTFTASSANAISPVEIDVRDLMTLCLKENDRRFAGYDARLLRPTTVPRLVSFALLVTKPWTRKKTSPSVQAQS
jgi:hypothetical protein